MNRVQNMPRSSSGDLTHQVHNSTSLSRLELNQMNQSILEPNQPVREGGDLRNMKMKFLMKRLVKKMRFLSPPWKTPDNLEEQWEAGDEVESKGDEHSFENIKESLSEEISNRFQAVKVMELFEGLASILFIWIVSVSIVFQTKIGVEVCFVIMAIIAGKLIVKAIVLCSDLTKQNTYEIFWFEDVFEPLFILIGGLLIVMRYYLPFNVVFEIVVSIYSAFVAFSEVRNIGRKFEFLTLYAEQNKKRKQLRIIELFGFTLAMAHLFALILYGMTYIPTPEGQNSWQNWLQKANLSNRSWYVYYIYSFYWANTTMVTVGYGDLIPANYIEAFVVTIIQIVGTAIFGYMINVIGITVSEINKKTAQFEEHQSTIYKLKDHYQLSRELCFKMKNDIKMKQNLSKSIPLKNNEENEFLDYIQPTLKDSFVLETNMKVIKKSIFFLTHFTVNFQNEVALKLIRLIYKPQEVIEVEKAAGQNEDQFHLFIINNGKVHISIKKHHHNQEFSKLGRVIDPKEGKPTLNVFGFSSLILNRKINLKAVTQETAAIYSLKRSDIIESIQKSILDFQSFHDLREKMMFAIKLESIEAPDIIDQEKHYSPNVFLLLKKIKYESQERRALERGSRKLRLKIITLKHYQNKTMLMIDGQKIEEPESLKSLRLMKELHDDDPSTFAEENQKDVNLTLGSDLSFDQAKHFENFMKNFNLDKISANYERFCLRKQESKKKSKRFSLRNRNMTAKTLQKDSIK